MVGFITSATVFTYLVGGPALATLRRHAPELKRPFKLPGYKVIAPIGFIGAALVVYWSGWPLDLFLWIAGMAGFVLWGLLYATKGIHQGFDAKALKAGIWGPVFITVLTFLTWIGSSTFYSGPVFGTIGGQPLNLIKFPYDVIVVIIVALIFYFWAAASGIKTEAIETIIKENSQYLTTEEKGAGGR